MADVTLAERIKRKAQNNYGPEDADWVQFISDHKLYIREKSTVKSFTSLDLVPYKYRPDEFFKANRGDINQTWIFLFVNDLRNPTDFNESITKLWIVDVDVLKELRRQYESTAQYQAKIAS